MFFWFFTAKMVLHKHKHPCCRDASDYFADAYFIRFFFTFTHPDLRTVAPAWEAAAMITKLNTTRPCTP